MSVCGQKTEKEEIWPGHASQTKAQCVLKLAPEYEKKDNSTVQM